MNVYLNTCYKSYTNTLFSYFHIWIVIIFHHYLMINKIEIGHNVQHDYSMQGSQSYNVHMYKIITK